jgi:hypothetical protein
MPSIEGIVMALNLAVERLLSEPTDVSFVPRTA